MCIQTAAIKCPPRKRPRHLPFAPLHQVSPSPKSTKTGTVFSYWVTVRLDKENSKCSLHMHRRPLEHSLTSWSAGICLLSSCHWVHQLQRAPLSQHFHRDCSYTHTTTYLDRRRRRCLSKVSMVACVVCNRRVIVIMIKCVWEGCGMRYVNLCISDYGDLRHFVFLEWWELASHLMWVLGTKLWSSARALYTLSSWAIPQAATPLHLKMPPQSLCIPSLFPSYTVVYLFLFLCVKDVISQKEGAWL